ncbi:MAG: ATP cone domain-containing protein [Kiritimatiellia bacterium]|nr:response regulator SirA [Lentisphaerota bacterium]
MQDGATIKNIIKRQGNLVAYDRDRISTAIFRALVSTGTKDRDLAERLGARVEQALVAAYGTHTPPSIEEIQDIVEETLFEAGYADTARAYQDYRHARAQARSMRACNFEVTDNIPYKKIYEVLCWNMAHECDSVPALNRLIERGDFINLMRAADRRYDEEIDAAAEVVLARSDRLRLIIVAGPSSSGKTTTTIKLAERLRKSGIGLQTINVDNYFFELERHPRDEFGDYDYESPQALDLPLIDLHLAQLLDGRTVMTPHYDFKTGRRHLAAHALKLEPGNMLLLDSLHGLYGPMTASVADEQKFRLYIETLGQLRAADGQFMRWADNRLMRRMIRDSWHRNSQPEATLTHWRYVRRSELTNIIPYIGNADFLVNSALPYEMPVLKGRIFDFFEPAIAKYRADPGRQDAYIRARRINDFLLPLTPAADAGCLAPDSLLREFVGGSCYEY